MINPHKPKYFNLYWQIAEAAAQQSTAIRSKVGAVIVAPTGMLSIGFNGTPSGFDNTCEHENSTGSLTTKSEVIHAERNAIDKMTRQGVSTEGSLLFVTMSPCFECAKSLIGLGFAGIYYDTTYRDTAGLQLLHRAKAPVYQRQEGYVWASPLLHTEANCVN